MNIFQAHNIEDVCRQAASLEMTHQDLIDACKQWERSDGAGAASQEACQFMHLEAVTVCFSLLSFAFLDKNADNLARNLVRGIVGRGQM